MAYEISEYKFEKFKILHLQYFLKYIWTDYLTDNIWMNIYNHKYEIGFFPNILFFDFKFPLHNVNQNLKTSERFI